MESTGLSSALNSDHSDEHGNSYCPATSASMHLSPVRTHRGISEHKKCVTCGESYSPNSNFSAPHEEYKPSFMIWKQLSEEYISNVPSFPLQIIKGQILSYLFPLCSGDMNRGNLQEDALTVEQFGSLAKTFGEAETVVGCNRTRELLWDIVNACLDNPGAQNYFGRTLSVTRRILYLLTHSAEEYELIDAALTAVAVLIRCGEYRPTTSVKNLNMLTTAGLAKILATVLRCHIDRHSTCERVFLVISHFAFDKRQRLQLVEEGVCEYIVKAIEIHKDHCVVIDRALSAIFNLIPEEKSVDIFVRCNIFEVLLPQLTSQSETIVSAAYGIIGIILQYPKHCGYIVQAGAVDAITLFPTLWINSEHTMQNYILAVGWLSFQGIGNLSHESKNHLYSITLSTLKMYPASKSIQLLGLLAFFSWVDDTDISPANKISTCATLMNILSNTDCYDVIILGCLLVSKIVNTADNMREFVGTLACAPLTKVTQLLVDNKFQCPTNSCGALLMAVSSAVSALCHETLANQQEFFRLGIIEILKGLLESDIANVTHVFPIALQMCMNKKTINTDIVDTMLIENIHTIVISSLNHLDIALEESTGVTCDMLGLVALLSFSVTFRHLFGAEGFQIILKYIQKYHSVRDVKVNLFLAFGSLVPYVDAECDLERFDTLKVIAMCLKRDKDDMSLIMSSTVAMTCAIRSNGSVLSLELADDIISSTKDLLQQYVSNRNIVICSLKLLYSVICADKSSVGSSNSYETLGLVKLLFDVLRRYINDKDVVCGTCWTLWLLDFVGGLVSTIESNDLILAAEKHIHDSVVCTYVFLVIKSLSKYEDVSIQRERLINFFNFCVHLHTEDDKCLSAAFQLLSTVIDHPDGLAVSIDFNGMLAAFRRAIDTSSAVLVSQIVADLCILLTYVEYQRVLGAMSIGELLLSCLEKGFASHDTEIRLLRCICYIFENVSDEQENRNDHNMAISLLNAGCVQVIIRTMERNTVCADIVEAGYSLLKNVALCSSGRIKIWYEWDYVSNHIDRYFDDPPIFARIVLVLQKLCLFEEVPKALTCPKYCKYFLVRHFDTDSEMSILSGKLISILLSFSDCPATARSAQEIFLEQNMVELVIGKLNDKSLPLERYVCEMEILFGLLNHNEISVGVLVNRDDLLSLLTDFVSAHISESSLALLSMIIVTELCSDRSLYTNIRQCKVLFNSSVHAIAVHEDNPAIVYNCCQCIVHFLRLFVEEELDFVDRNLISTLTDAMRRNMENESLANIASNAITMLSRRFNVEAAREANDVKTQFERIAEMLSEAAKFKDFALIATSSSEIVDLSCGEIDENVSLISSRIYEQLHEALVVSVGNSFAQIAILKAIVYLCGHNDRPFQHRSHVVGKFIAMRTDLAVFRCLSMMYHNCRISEFATLLLHFFISYSNSSDESLELPRLLQLTCEVLNRHDDDMTTLQNSCLLITTILNASNNSELCSSDHLCEQLCVSLLTGMNDSTSALRIVSALSSLIYTQSYDHATYMVRRQHILKNLLSILRAHMEHNSTVTAVCTLITNLSVSIGKDFNAILYELGGHQVLIEVLRRDSCTSETTIYSVYDTIYTVSQHMSPCSNHFNHNGIWELVIRDVERFQWEANVMKIVCLCIPVLLIETDDLVGINFQIMLEMCIKIPRVHSRKCEVILAVVMAIECILGTEFSFSISTLRSLLDMLGPLFEQYLHEHELVQQFSLILIRITSRINEFEHIENFIDCSLCGTIVSGLYTYSRHETIFSLFCSLLSSMFSDSIAYSSKLYDCGICDTLDSILRENFNDLNVFRHTCEVMSAVPPHSKCSQRLSSLDICRNVSCMIVRFNVDPDIGLLWTKAIIVLASEERSFPCFKETDLIEKLWWLLENCDSNELVVQSVFQIFYLLGVHEDFCSALCSENGCEKLIVHLEKYTGSPDVLLSVLKSLCVLSVHGEYRIRFRSRRVAIVVYKIVTTFAAEDILKEAFKLISILSSCNADMQNIFFEIGVLDAVCDYVNQSSEINLVGAALGATAKMIERNEMRKSWVAEKNLCDELTNWSTRLYNLSPQTLLNILTAIKCFSEMESYYLKSFSTATFVELYIISLKSYVTLLGASTEYDDLYCTLLTVSVMTSSSIYCTDSKLQIKVCDLFLESVHMKSSARITALAIEYISAIVKSDKLLISRCYDSGILDRYVELLTVCTDERTTFPVICQSIVVFSNSNKNLLAEYVDQRLIDSIVKRILEFRSDVLIVSDGYEALVSLISPELMSSVNFELLVVLVTAVVNSVDEESILKRLCSTVAILAHMSPSLSNLLGSARVCDALIHILYIHFGNLDIYSAVIVAVVNLTAESDTNCAVFAAAGLCSGLSQWFSCELSPSNVVNTCCAIVNICADNGGAMSNMAREGKCASLLSLYDKNIGQRACVLSILRVVEILVRDKLSLQESEHNNCVNLLQLTAKQYDDDPEVFSLAMGLLSSFDASVPTTQSEVFQSACIKAVESLKLYIHNAEMVCELCSGIISLMANSDVSADILGGCGLCVLCDNILKNHSQNANVVSSVCIVIGYLALNSATSLKTFEATSVAQQIVASYDVFLDVFETCSALTFSIRNLVRSDVIMVSMMEYGVCDSLMKSLELYSKHNGDIVAMNCWALRKLTSPSSNYDNTHALDVVIQRGGLLLTCDIISHNSHNIPTFTAAVALLGSIISNGIGIVEAEQRIRGALMSALSKHIESENLCRYGLCLLVAFVENITCCTISAANSESCDIVLESVQEHMTCSAIADMGCEYISRVVLIDTELVGVLNDRRRLDVILQCLLLYGKEHISIVLSCVKLAKVLIQQNRVSVLYDVISTEYSCPGALENYFTSFEMAELILSTFAIVLQRNFFLSSGNHALLYVKVF